MAMIINLADGLTGIGQRILGANANDVFGIAVSGGGDFNDDGIMDIVVGAPQLDGGAVDSGGAYIIFGGVAAFASEIDVSSLGAAGVTLTGPNGSANTGLVLASGGDFNGDGVDDLLIGSPDDSEGLTYVVFGSSSIATSLDLGSLSTAGFVIDGEGFSDDAGIGIANLGDVDGDTIDDFLIGAPNNDTNGSNFGAAYVLYGDGSFGTDITLAAADIKITTTLSGSLGARAAGGDINGDGTPDIVVGKPYSNIYGNGLSSDGAVHVIFGSGSLGASYSVDSLGAAGFSIFGPTNYSEAAGAAVSVVGDINNDGIDDLAVGAHRAGDSGQGAIYLIFGSAGLGSDINLDNLGSAGIKISGAADGDYVGRAISPAGDFNGDGIDDLVFGANTPRGTVYVLFGSTSGFTSDIDLANLSATQGLIFNGEATNDNFGFGFRSVSGVGDVNSDGIDDILVGAGGVDQAASYAGAAYVLFGFATTGGTTGDDSLTGGDGIDSLVGNEGNDTLIGNAGNDFLFGGLNDDSLEGGAGDDLLSSGTGNDSLFGGAGTDTAELGFGDQNQFQVRLLTGSQLDGLLSQFDEDLGLVRQAVFTGAAVRMQFTGGEAGFQLLATDIEKVQFGNGTVDLSAIVDIDLAELGIEELFVGGTGDNVVTGESTDDIMAAGEGNDTVDGAGGADRAYGQAGDDSVSGGTGNDSLFGNLGNDTVIGGDGDDSMKAQTNDDVIMGESGNDVAFGGGNDDSIDGGADSDTLNGNSGFDTILGGAGNDTLRGQGGRDSLAGGDGDDLLLGMQGFDTLVGGAGNDGLIGGPADDVLTGGVGDDIFTFAAGQGGNIITDFENGSDRIALQGLAAFSELVITDTENGAQVTIASGGDDLSITLTGITANQLAAADFIFG